MLVLSRKINEVVVIGGNIRVCVIGIGQGRVRLGIDADPSIAIDREEIHEVKERAKRYLE